MRQQQRLQQRNVQRLQRRDYGGGAYGGGESSTTASEESSSAAGGGETALVSTGNAGDLGTVLVDSEGMTLYDFHKDKGTTSVLLRSLRNSLAPPEHLR